MPSKPKMPAVLSLNGEPYVPVVLLIHTKFPDGTPALMKRIRDDDKIELAGGEEFMIGYAPKHMVRGDGSKL